MSALHPDQVRAALALGLATENVSYEAGVVRRIEERFESACISGFGDKAVMEQKSIGWFVVLDTGAAFGVGSRQPPATTIGTRAYIEFR